MYPEDFDFELPFDCPFRHGGPGPGPGGPDGGPGHGGPGGGPGHGGPGGGPGHGGPGGGPGHGGPGGGPGHGGPGGGPGHGGPGGGPGHGGPGGGPGHGGPGGGPGHGGPGGGPGHGGPGGHNEMGPPMYPPPSIYPKKIVPGYGPKFIDYGALGACTFRYVYIWLRNGNSFWAWLTYVGRRSVAGWRWNGAFWVYFGVDLRRIDSFICR